MLMGFLGAAGLCALIWCSSILDTALGDPPLRTHPAFITFMLVMVPAMLLGAVGALAGVVLPLFARFGIRYKCSPKFAKFLRAYATRILSVVEDDSPSEHKD